MIDGLKPYPKYKDSGASWLGEVPEHWEVARNGRLFAERREVGFPELPVLEVSLRTGVRVRNGEAGARKQALGDLAAYKRARAGDIAYNMMRMWQGAVGVAPVDGLVSPAYVVARPFAEADSRYYEYLFRTPAYMGEVNNYSRGIVADRNRLYWDEFKDVRSPVPPPGEQALIVRFLRALDQRITRYVRAKKKLISLLNEQRHKMTNEAVEAAREWCRLARVAVRVFRPIERRDQDRYRPIGVFSRGRGLFHKRATKGSELGDSDFFWLEEGDLVVSGQFAWEGAIALVSEVDKDCVASHRYHVLRGNPDTLDIAYLSSFLQTTYGQMLLDVHSRGAAGRNRPLNIISLMREKIPVPPSDAQKRIAALVRREGYLQLRFERTIERVHGFRMTLLSDVVMGKLDVREAARRLPINEPADEFPEIGDTEEETGDESDAELEAVEVED